MSITKNLTPEEIIIRSKFPSCVTAYQRSLTGGDNVQERRAKQRSSVAHVERMDRPKVRSETIGRGILMTIERALSLEESQEQRMRTDIEVLQLDNLHRLCVNFYLQLKKGGAADVPSRRGGRVRRQTVAVHACMCPIETVETSTMTEARSSRADLLDELMKLPAISPTVLSEARYNVLLGVERQVMLVAAYEELLQES